MQKEQKQNCFLMLYAQLIVYTKYSWLFFRKTNALSERLDFSVVCLNVPISTVSKGRQLTQAFPDSRH